MEVSPGFNACRVCLTSNEIFVMSENSAKFLSFITEIKIIEETKNHDVKICQLCLKELKRISCLIQLIKKADREYFEGVRELRRKAESKKMAEILDEEVLDDSREDLNEAVIEVDDDEGSQESEENEKENSHQAVEESLKQTNEQSVEIVDDKEKEEESASEQTEIVPKIFSRPLKTSCTLNNQKPSKRTMGKCLICNEKFSKMEFMEHVKTVHKNDGKEILSVRFECDLCKKQFFSKSNLRQHIEIHSWLKVVKQ
jgi:hypothetical protein